LTNTLRLLKFYSNRSWYCSCPITSNDFICNKLSC